MVNVTPWTHGPFDKERIDRYNARLRPDDPRRVRYVTTSGRPLYPCHTPSNFPEAWTAVES